MDVELTQAERLLLAQAEEGDWSLRDTLIELNSGLPGHQVECFDWRSLRPLAEATVRSLRDKGLIELYRRGVPLEPQIGLTQREAEAALGGDDYWRLDWNEPTDIPSEAEVVLFTTEKGSALYQTGITMDR